MSQVQFEQTDPQTFDSLPESPGLNLKINESVLYLDPETNKVLELVVLGFRQSKQGGIRYTVAYADNDDVEVELNEDEMRAILYKQVSAEDLNPEPPFRNFPLPLASEFRAGSQLGR